MSSSNVCKKPSIQRLFDIKRTQLQLVQDRGYILPEQEQPIKDFTLKQFCEYILALGRRNRGDERTLLSRAYRTPEGVTPRKNMLVYYGSKNADKTQIPIEVVDDFIKQIRDRNATGKEEYIISEAMLIIDGDLTSTGRDHLRELRNVHYLDFNDSDLVYNATHHYLTPKHELISKEEEGELLCTMKAKKSQLLLIEASDPVVKYYGWRVGDVLRIHRNNDAINILDAHSINYRTVIED
jgi:DNA-directed RNA polymerase subunit H (RpoH/RPB5)